MLHHPHQRKTYETHADFTSDVSSCLASKVVMCRCGQAVWNSIYWTDLAPEVKVRMKKIREITFFQYNIRAEERIQVAERTVKKEGLALGTFGV